MDAQTRPGQTISAFQRGLRHVTLLSARNPWITLCLCVGLALGATWLTETRLKFKTNRADLIDPQTDYHQRWLNYLEQFGDVSEDMVVVVEQTISRRLRRLSTTWGRR